METDIKYIKGKKLFNFKLVAIGLIFLIDFNVNTIDILPDIFALILISAGLGKIWYANENLANVKRYINIFYIAATVKLFWNAVYFIFGSRAFNGSLILLLTFLFSGLELILCMFIFTNMFKGFETYFQISGSISHEKRSDSVLGFLKFFIVLKFILTVITQIPVLLSDNTWDNLSMVFDRYLDADFVKNLLIPPCFIIQTLVGLLVLSLVMPFFFDIAKDKNFYDSVKSRINRMLINDNFFSLKQTLNSAFMLFIIGSVFLVDLHIDNINILPDFFICLFFLSGISRISKTNPDIKNTKLNILLLINFIISVLSYTTGTIYRLKEAVSFIGENVNLLNILKVSHNISFDISIIIFFLIFIEFYAYIINFQRKNLEFSVRYLNKYLTLSEKNFDKNSDNIIKISSLAFCVKTISSVLPEFISFVLPNWEIILYFNSAIIIAFVFLTIKKLYSIKESVYSYYNK